jgi:hypothetical protein
MKTCNYSSLSSCSLEGRYDAALLERLGSELAHVYHESLQASLPPALQELVNRLEVQTQRGNGADARNPTHLS